MPYHLDNTIFARQPLDHRGRLRRHRGIRRRGPLPSLHRTGGHHRPGRPRPGGASQPAAPGTSTQRMWAASRAMLSPTGLARAYVRPIGYSVHAFREGDSVSYGHRYAGLPPPRQLPVHRLHRQRRRTQSYGSVPCGAGGISGSSTRATTPTGVRSSWGMWPTRSTGMNRPSTARPATCCPPQRSSGRTC